MSGTGVPEPDERQLRELEEQLRRRQWSRRAPQRMADVISGLLARRGYAQLQSSALSAEAWASAAGPELARDSRPGGLRRGVLDVTVRNSAVLQELTFQKQRLLVQLQQLMPEHRLRDLRFRVGSLD